jgi:hypothetical protein
MQAASKNGTKSTDNSSETYLSIFFTNRNLQGNDLTAQTASAPIPYLERQCFHHLLKGHDIGLTQRPDDVDTLDLAIST